MSNSFLDLKSGLGITFILVNVNRERKGYSVMGKTVLIVSSSPRKNGNSETLAEAFANGAREAGHSVETVRLREKQMGFCRGCLACLKLGRCVIQDDAVEIAAKMHDADVLVFATPVYYYSVCGQLKTMPAALTRFLAPIMHSPRHICWRRRRRTGARPSTGRKRRCRDGLTVSPAARSLERFSPAA